MKVRGWKVYMHRKAITCADGFTMSVQASENHYCSPRLDVCVKYETVEVGYPSEKEDIFMPYAEEPEKPCETVYAYVPVSQVTLVIAKHGGIGEGETPPGVAYLVPNERR